VQADRLLPPELSDVDGIVETRRGTLSAFNGQPPIVRVLDTEAEETAVVAEWLKERVRDGVLPGEIGLFVRSEEQIARARAAAATAGLEAVELILSSTAGESAVTLGTMHLAKGLEFRAVVVLACDDEVIPLQSRIESVADDADLQDTYDTERHLLYVACTRAREHLLVTGVAPGSEFLEDMAAS
jgi:superfamily I DNA/RNA helicase